MQWIANSINGLMSNITPSTHSKFVYYMHTKICIINDRQKQPVVLFSYNVNDITPAAWLHCLEGLQGGTYGLAGAGPKVNPGMAEELATL